MTQFYTQERLFPTDLLFKNFFDNSSIFQSYADAKPTYPVDIATTEAGLVIEIAAVGIDKKDIQIETSGNTLKVSYSKGEEDSPAEFEYIHRGIARRGFNLGWKIAPKYDVTSVTATLDKGLLSVFVPLSEEAKPNIIKIK